MKGFLQLLFCLQVAVINGQKKQNCLDDLKLKPFTGCTDYDAWIACFRKLINENSGSPSDVQNWESSIGYYKAEKERELSCPSLKERGSCISKEIFECVTDDYVSVRDHCNRLPDELRCLEDIGCDRGEIFYQILRAKGDIKSCSSGDLKAMMEREVCVEQIQKCTEKFYEFHDANQFSEAKKTVKSSNKCLDNITCDKDGDVEYERNKMTKQL